MQDLTYRAKVLNSKHWIYRQPFHIRGTWYMYNSFWNKVRIDYHTIGKSTDMQCKDKHGAAYDIFQGDLIRFKVKGMGNEQHIATVQFDQKNGEWIVTGPGKGIEFSLAWVLYQDKDTQIAGNIYDNPRLIGRQSG